MQNLDELLRKAEEIRQEVRIGGNTAQRVGLVLVQLVDAAQALLAQIQEEERLRQETDASIKKDINTLDEKVEDLPSPVAPLSSNNGLLELKYDTESLYVQDGKLCARLPEVNPSDPVPGAGIIYSEGAGISIDDENIISVRIGKSLELDNNGAIRVGTGEGLVHNKEGRLSVNIGKGLSLDEYSNKIVLEDNDYIKSLPSLFDEKQDVIEAGNGLEKVGNLLKVEDTLVSDVIKSKQHISSLQVEINQQSIQISSKQDKLSEGLGIIISENNEISVNGNVLSVEHAKNASNDASGRSISGTYATQEEVGSVARSLAGVETKVDANAAAIEELRNNEDIIFGDGLSHVGNVVEVDSNIISGIADNAREIEGIIGDVNDLQSSVSDLATIRANATNGGKAYDWGNHGTAGYAKAVKVGDKRYEADPSAIISLPAYPTSLPASGGNADTLDGHDSSYFATKTDIEGKQDKLTQGSGIEITSENVINVDGSTMHVQLSTNAINDEDGNRIRATYVKKDEIDGIYGAIEATNTTVASHTQSIGSLELNKQDKLDFGNGLSTVGNLVKVEDAVLKDIADNKKNIETLSGSIGDKQDKLTASDGINLDGGKLSVHIGTGLEFDPLSSAVVVKVGAGVTTDINQSLAIKHDTTLTTDADGQLGVNQGTITNIAASEVAKVVANAPANYDTLKEIADYIATDAEGAAQLSNRIGALESELPNKMNAVAFGSGLAFSGNVVKVDDAVMTDISSNKSNITKLQSSVDGLSTNKQDTISDLATIRSNAANGATAYGWGSHGTAGYAKKVKVGNTTYEADADAVVSLPAYPTSLPANGGVSDTAYNLYSSGYLTTDEAIDAFIEGNCVQYATFQSPSNAMDFKDRDGMILTIPWSTDQYGIQMAFDDDPTTIKVRGLTNSVWGGWKQMAFTSDIPTFGDGFENVDNTIKISTAYITEKIKGDGLVLDESGKMSVDRSKVVTVSGRQSIEGKDFTSAIAVASDNDAKLTFNNTDNENKYQFISFQQNGVEYGTLGTLGDDELRWRSSRVIHEHNIADYVATLSANYAVGAGNADTLDGYEANNIDVAFTNNRGSMVDLLGLDPNYYYPCSTPTTSLAPTYIKIWVSLGDFENAPSWATHGSGFVLNLEWKTVGEGWGTTSVNRVVYSAKWNWADMNPCGGYAHNLYNSEEIVWLRGGAKYFCRTTQNQTLTVHPNGYSWSSGNYRYAANIRSKEEIDSPYANCYHSKLGVGELVTTSNVGVGVTDPQYKLDVNGNTRLSASDDNPLYLHSTKKDSEGACRIYFEDGNNAWQGYVMSGWGDLFLAHRSLNQIGVGDNGIWCSKDNGNTKYPILHTGNIGDGFENVGGTIKISTSYITEKIKGNGLILDGSGKMSVDTANLSVKNADTIGGLYNYDFVRRTDTQAFLPKFVLEEIPKNLTQVGSIGWEDYQNHPYAGGLFLTLKGMSSLSTAMIMFPTYDMHEPPRLYSSIDNSEWQGGYQLAYRSDIPTFGDGFEQVNDTIKISTAYITEKIKGDGLVLDESGKMSVDSSKVVTTSDDQTINGQKNFTGQLSIMGGHDLELCASDAWPTDAGDIVFCNKDRQEIGRFWLDINEPRKFRIRYGGNDSGKDVIHSGNIADYAAPLSVNYANSAGSVAWGNVSGRPSFGNGFDSTNNVIQLKLSTGLAIDDRGYLYVTGL